MATTKAKQPFKKPRPAMKRGHSQAFGHSNYQLGRQMPVTPKAELKAFDLSSTTNNFTTGGVNVPALNAAVNGAELYQRVGRKCYGKSIRLRGLISNIATAVQDVLRIIIYFDSQPNAAAPASLAALLQDSNAAGTTNALSEINLTNRQRFQILRDKSMATPSVTNTAGVLTNAFYPETEGGFFAIDHFIKIKGLESVYNGTNGGTIADITSGAIGFYLVSLNNNNSWSLTWTSRYRFYD